MPEKIISCSNSIGALNAGEVADVRIAFIDTFSVIYAGWNEPVTTAVRAAYGQINDPVTSAGRYRPDAEQAALVWGTAAHALDFDDVHTTSVTHPSAVLVPAIEALVAAEGLARDRIASAYLVGLSTNVALGEALGFGHYVKGWHATSTIGPVAAAAALAHLLELDERRFRSALSIAVSQAAGTRRNFGTMAKPLHAGLAAAAGVRAVRLASAGLEASKDAFGATGYLDLYSGMTRGKPLNEIEMATTPGSLSRKLYPCCYMAHRPIAAAVQVRDSIPVDLLEDENLTVEVSTPYGCTKALVVDIPTTGLEAKFSGSYAVAAALIYGDVPLSAFEDAAVARPSVQSLLRRVRLSEEEMGATEPVGIDHGTVRIAVKKGADTIATSQAQFYPGSPSSPITQDQVNAKLDECLVFFNKTGQERMTNDQILEAVTITSSKQGAIAV